MPLTIDYDGPERVRLTDDAGAIVLAGSDAAQMILFRQMEWALQDQMDALEKQKWEYARGVYAGRVAPTDAVE
jgi:ATP-dependent protease HslVU (ClpYQ) peptidase subunit